MSGNIPPSIALQVAQARQIIEKNLSDSVVGIHLFGSAVDGGLQPYSDIDLLVAVNQTPSEATCRALMTELLTASAPAGVATSLRALEVTVLALEHVVPWRYPARRELQFGEWLRDDLLADIVEGPMVDNDLAILLTKARAKSVVVAGQSADTLFEAVPHKDVRNALLDTVAQWNKAEDWEGEERNIILALARIWFTATNGEITSKASAAAWLLERIEPPYRLVLSKARAGYLGQEQDDLASYAPEVEAFIMRAQREIRRLCSPKQYAGKGRLQSG